MSTLISGTNFERFYFERGGDFGEHFSGECFYSESALYLLLARQNYGSFEAKRITLLLV